MATFELTCAGCGEPFEAKTSRAKWCSARCRKRAQRRPAAPPAEAPDASVDEGAGDQPCVCRGNRLVSTVVRDLETAARLDSSPGQIAVAYAVEATRPGATGVAGLLNGLRQALAEAIGKPEPDPSGDEPEDEDDPVARAEDELARKRAALSAG